MNNRIERFALPYPLDNGAVTLAIEHLAGMVVDASLPFGAIDTFEYWLLDASNKKPPAPLQSGTSEVETEEQPPIPEWLAMPATGSKSRTRSPQRRTPWLRSITDCKN